MINEDTRFDIAYKVLDTTGKKASMDTLDNVIALIMKGASLDNITFGVISFGNYNKHFIKVA